MADGILRRDPLNKIWVVFAPEKVKTIVVGSSENDANFDVDPFVPGLEYATGPDILRSSDPLYSTGGWSSRVFPAKNPVLKVENEKNSRGHGLYDSMSRLGAHEVVVETPKSGVSMDQLSVEEIADAVKIIFDRIADLRKDTRFRYISVTKSRGRAAGGQINHNYSEIKAYPFIPPFVRNKLDNCLAYYREKERCLLCDIIDQELADRKRIVAEHDNFVAFCPYSSRFPFEIMVVPKKHGRILSDNPASAIADFAKILKPVMSKLRSGLNSPAYNMVFHYLPVNSGAEAEAESRAYHWHLEIIPRITVISADSFENGIFVNPTLPEDAAEFLRNIRE
ncbi:HIT domain-containing protein [bacterium]|nr:HIT domain-containing protein [bacterium]